MTVTDGTVLSAGRRLEYRIWGEGAPELILLHEGLGCVALWKDFPAALGAATGRTVLAYSRAGYGGSDPDDLPRPLDWMKLEAERLRDVTTALGAERAVLVGHSDGATIAALRAGFWGDPPGVVLMAPHFFTEEMGLAEITRAREAFQASDLPARMAKYHRDARATFYGWADAWLDPRFKVWNVEHALDAISCPILAIQGAGDQYGTLRQIEVIAERAQGPVDSVVFERCRHSPHLERGADTIEHIVGFLSKYAL